MTERRLIFVCRDKRYFHLNRYRIGKFLSTVLQYGEFESLHVNLEKIDCGNLCDVVQTSGGHLMLGDDVSPLRHWYELMQLTRVRLEKARHQGMRANVQHVRSSVADGEWEICLQVALSLAELGEQA